MGEGSQVTAGIKETHVVLTALQSAFLRDIPARAELILPVQYARGFGETEA